MANKVVGFTINIEGIETINQLNAAIAQTKAELKNLVVGTEEYAAKSKQLAKLQDELKAVNKQQTELQKSLSETNKNLGAYDQLSAKLNRLRKEYKNLAVTEQAASKEAQDLLEEIQRLDKQLKDVDASAGQFQRNVGNYPKTFAKITRSLIQTIPGFEAFDNLLRNSEGNLTGFGKALVGGFVAFQAGKFIVQAVGQLNELVKKIDETKNAVASFSGASGQELNNLTADVQALAMTFEADANDIASAAESIAKKTGVSFGEALKQVENGLLKGNEATSDFLTNISEVPEAYENAGEATGDYADRQRDLLDANKELSAAQVETAQKLGKFGNEMKVIGTNIQTFLLKGLMYLYDLIKPVVRTFYEFGAAIYSVVQSFEPLKIIFESIYNLFANLPAIFAGVIGAMKQLAVNFVSTFKILALDTQILAQRLKGYFVDTSDVINDLLRQREAVVEDTKTIAEAFSESYNKYNEELQQDLTETNKEQADIRERDAAEAAKRAREEQQRQYEQLQKDREKFLEDELKFRQQQSEVILTLQKKTADLLIKNVKDEQARRLKEAEKDTKENIENAQKEIESLKKLNAEREQEAVKLYGAKSKEVQKLRGENAQKEIEAQKEFQAFSVEEEKRYQDEILAIKQEGFQDAINLRTENFNKTIEQLTKASESELLELEKNRLLGLVNAEEYNTKLLLINKRRIEKEIEENKKQVEINEKLQAEGIAIDEEQNAELLSKNQQLYVDLLNAEKDYTEKAGQLIEERIEKSEEEYRKRKDAIQKNIDDAANYTTQALDLVNQFAQATDAQRNARYAAQEEQNQKAIESLNERLNTATGLERRYLQQELQREQENANKIAKAKEEAEKESAKREKAIAVIQSIIQGALAVSKAIASAPPPFNIPAIVAAGIQAAAQTAIIAAQPLAKGGVVGKLDGEIVQFAGGGKVTNQGNIKPLSNGDNVLATLKTGEVVLNREQQSRIGYSTLKSAKIPGFAAGGMVGAPTSLISGTNQIQAEQMQQINTFKDTINAVNSRIDRIQVVYTASTDYDVELSRQDKKTIKANASF